MVGDGVRVVIVGEFSRDNVLYPGSRVGAAENLKVSFYFLVNTFSFSIRFEGDKQWRGQVRS